MPKTLKFINGGTQQSIYQMLCARETLTTKTLNLNSMVVSSFLFICNGGFIYLNDLIIFTKENKFNQSGSILF